MFFLKKYLSGFTLFLVLFILIGCGRQRSLTPTQNPVGQQQTIPPSAPPPQIDPAPVAEAPIAAETDDTLELEAVMDLVRQLIATEGEALSETFEILGGLITDNTLAINRVTSDVQALSNAPVVLHSGPSDPSNPAVGEMWLRTDIQ